MNEPEIVQDIKKKRGCGWYKYETAGVANELEKSIV